MQTFAYLKLIIALPGCLVGIQFGLTQSWYRSGSWLVKLAAIKSAIDSVTQKVKDVHKSNIACQMKLALRVFVIFWIAAPLVVVVTLSFVSKSIAAVDKAQIWMMASALLCWCTFSLILFAVCARFGLFSQPVPKQPVLRCTLFVGLATVLALIEEVCTQFMTEHAQLFGVRLGDAYITPSLDYWDTVMHHSVIVFVPMFAMCALLTEKWWFSPREIFYLIGLTGLTAEMTMNPASLFMGFWLLIYGFMVLIPSMWLYRGTGELAKRRWWHYPLTITLMLLSGAIGSLLLHGVFPQHPDNHFALQHRTSAPIH